MGTWATEWEEVAGTAAAATSDILQRLVYIYNYPWDWSFSEGAWVSAGVSDGDLPLAIDVLGITTCTQEDV